MSQHSWVSVSVVAGRGLAAMDRNGFSDPYCKVFIPAIWGKATERKTLVKKKTLDPEWNNTFLGYNITKVDILKGAYDDKPILVEIWDWDRIGKDDFMGQVEISLKTVLEQEGEVDDWFKVVGRPNRKKPDKVSGEIHLIIEHVDKNMDPEELAKWTAQVQLSQDKINELWRKFSGENREVKTPNELVDIMRDCGLLDSVVSKWNITDGKEELDASSKQLIFGDKEVMGLIGKQFFDAMDSDNSGSIDWPELILGLSTLSEGSKEDRARLQFKARDTDHSGTLTKDEARALSDFQMACFRAGFALGIRHQAPALRKAGLTERDFDGIIDGITEVFEQEDVKGLQTDMLFQFADTDGDGFITEDEYVSWVCDPAQVAAFQAEIQTRMQPVTAKLTVRFQREVGKLMARCMNR